MFPSKKRNKNEPVSVWRQPPGGGTRYCQIPPIHDQDTGVKLERIVLESGVTPQKVVTEALECYQALKDGRLMWVVDGREAIAKRVLCPKVAPLGCPELRSGGGQFGKLPSGHIRTIAPDTVGAGSTEKAIAADTDLAASDDLAGGTVGAGGTNGAIAFGTDLVADTVGAASDDLAAGTEKAIAPGTDLAAGTVGAGGTEKAIAADTEIAPDTDLAGGTVGAAGTLSAYAVEETSPDVLSGKLPTSSFEQALLFAPQRVALPPSLPVSGLKISFGKTLDYLPHKSVTRRVWKDSHAAKFIRAYENNQLVEALDKDARANGKRIGYLELVCEPYKEKLSDDKTNFRD